jgi:hypothetical protein
VVASSCSWQGALTCGGACGSSLAWLHLGEVTWQFESLLAAQVDFTQEGEQLQQFNANFRKWDYVAFPRPILAHPAALIESFEEVRRHQRHSLSPRAKPYSSDCPLPHTHIFRCPIHKLLLLSSTSACVSRACR